jgi:hypothetical protein
MTMIFVFGSNLAGRHGAGAALYAHKHRGAACGVGEGLTGQSYALPTVDADIRPLPFADVDAAIGRFCAFAGSRHDLDFELTPVGCGLAGHRFADVWASLRRHGLPRNVRLSSTWITDWRD